MGYSGISVTGARELESAGYDVSLIGDVNGDGFDDFLIGVPNDTYVGYGSYAGAAYVIFGNADGAATVRTSDIDGTNGFRITPAGATDPSGVYDAQGRLFGNLVTGVGDMNGDGVEDFVVAAESANESPYGAPLERPNFIYVVFGRSDNGFGAELAVSGLNGNNGFQIAGVDGIVTDIVAAGDMNGDGLGDLLIGQTPVAQDDDGSGSFVPEAGNAGYVIFGANGLGAGGALDVSTLDGTNGFAVDAPRSVISGDAYAYAGFYQYVAGGLAALGDVNGDGFDDIGIHTVTGQTTLSTEYNYDYGYAEYSAITELQSRSYALFGKDTNVSAFAAVVDPTDGNQATELLWNAASFDGTYGDGTYSYVGQVQFTGLGDINGDGFADVAVSDPNIIDLGFDTESGEDAIGRVGIYFGGPDGVDTDGDGVLEGLNQTGGFEPGAADAPDVIIVKSDNRQDNFGYTLAALGDVNGDGIDDFGISAPFSVVATGSILDESAFIIFGRDMAAGDNFAPVIDLDNLDPLEFANTGYRIVSVTQYDGLGLSLSAAGDINGDGFNDVLVGAPGTTVPALEDGGDSAGTAHVIFGGADILAATDGADGQTDNIIFTDSLVQELEFEEEVPTSIILRAGQNSVEGDPDPFLFENFISFTLIRSTNLQDEITLDFTLEGIGPNPATPDDFTADEFFAGTIGFDAGEAEITVTFDIEGDVNVEEDEMVQFTISNPQTSGENPVELITSTALATITNDDQPVIISVNGSSVNEGGFFFGNQVTFNITRSGELETTVDVEYETFFPTEIFEGYFVTGDDFSIISDDPEGRVIVTFEPFETTKTISFDLFDDDLDETYEFFGIRLLDAFTDDIEIPVEIERAQTFSIVYDDDPAPGVRVTGGETFDEFDDGVTNVVFTFERIGDVTEPLEVKYDLFIRDDFAETVFEPDLNDFVGLFPEFEEVVIFTADQRTAEVTVRVTGDTEVEFNEFFEIRITETFGLDEEGFPVPIDIDIFNDAIGSAILNDDFVPPIPRTFSSFIPFDAWGDPHIITGDGLGYDFQAAGDFIYLETPADDPDPFQVQVRLERVPGSDLVSTITRMAVEVQGSVIEVDALGGNTLLIDGNPVTDGQINQRGVDLNGDGLAEIVFDEAFSSFSIFFNDLGEGVKVDNEGGFLTICAFLSDDFEAGGHQALVRGLVGSADGDISNDFALRDGTAIPASELTIDPDTGAPSLSFDFLYGRGAFEGIGFADSWRLDPAGTGGTKDSLFTNVVDFGDAFPPAAISLDDLPVLLREAAEAAATDAGIDPSDTFKFEAAVLDFVLTGDPSFFDAALAVGAISEAGSVPTDAPVLPATIGVTALEGSVLEGDSGITSAVYSFYRIGDTNTAVDVDYAISGDVSADDLNDGTAFTGQVSFAPGENMTFLVLGVLGDLSSELDENLTVSITNVSGDGLVAGPSANIVIETDDFGPDAVNKTFSVSQNESLAATVFTSRLGILDSDPENDLLSVVAVNGIAIDPTQPLILASGATLEIDETGVFAYNPFGINDSIDATDGFTSLPFGVRATDSFSYTISDGNGGFDTATIVLNVNGINDAPVAQPVMRSIDENAPALIISPEFFDPDTGDQFRLTLDLTDTLGSVRLNADGTFTYRITSDAFELLNAGEQGIDTFLYTVTDVFGASSTQTVTISILGKDDFVIAGTEQRDILSGENSSDTILANGGSDEVSANDGDDFVDGGRGRDTLFGGAGADTILGGAGADIIEGGAGDDELLGGGRNDRLAGQDGNDFIEGNNGRDILSGGAGNDILDGGRGSDLIMGHAGDDIISGQRGSDVLFGGLGADLLNGFGLNDELHGGEGNDQLFGMGGADSLFGDGGDDELIGGGGNDLLMGGAGNDILDGRRGDDILSGGAGIDVLSGRSGSDTFIFEIGHELVEITDFRNDVDKVDLSTFEFSSIADAVAAMTELDGDVIFRVSLDTLTIRNTEIQALMDDLII